MIKYNVLLLGLELVEMAILKENIITFCLNINTVTEVVHPIEDSSFNENDCDILFFDTSLDKKLLDKFKLLDVVIIYILSDEKTALDAYQNKALDFILKPIKLESVIIAYNRAINKIEVDRYQKSIYLKNTKVLESDYITVVSLYRIDIIRMRDILFCRAEGKYTTVYLENNKKIVSSKNLGEFEKNLNKLYFCRVHNSYIVNIRHLIGINKSDGVYCEFINKITVPISKRRQESFIRFIQN